MICITCVSKTTQWDEHKRTVPCAEMAPLFKSSYSFKGLLSSTGGKLPYVFSAIAWGNTLYSIFCEDFEKRANNKGITLQ